MAGRISTIRAIFEVAKVLFVGARAESEVPECKVCGNLADANGEIRHGKGCYVVSEDGGGSSFVDMPDGRQ